jgi:hypothetical protein
MIRPIPGDQGRRGALGKEQLWNWGLSRASDLPRSREEKVARFTGQTGPAGTNGSKPERLPAPIGEASTPTSLPRRFRRRTGIHGKYGLAWNYEGTALGLGLCLHPSGGRKRGKGVLPALVAQKQPPIRGGVHPEAIGLRPGQQGIQTRTKKVPSWATPPAGFGCPRHRFSRTENPRYYRRGPQVLQTDFVGLAKNRPNHGCPALVALAQSVLTSTPASVGLPLSNLLDRCRLRRIPTRS